MSTMKLAAAALILIYCCVATYAQPEPTLQRKLHVREDECVGDQDVLYTIARIDQLRSTRQLPQDGSLHEFAMCMLKNYQIYKPDGTINTDVKSHTLISEEPAQQAASLSQDCIAKTGTDDKDTLSEIFECYLRSGGIYIIDFAPRTRAMKPRSLF